MREAVRALLPEGVVGVEMLGACAAPPLLPEEFAAVEKAVPKRQREFALGRACAREALAAVGASSAALLPQPDRTVAWPPGFVGSITHADGYAAALAASTEVAAGLGIDAEVKDRVEPRLWDRIASPIELAWLRSVASPGEGLLLATRLFSAKEAFYKAQYCVSRAWVGFHDVCVTFDASSFEVELLVDVEGLAPRGARFGGRHVTADSHVITTLTLHPSRR